MDNKRINGHSNDVKDPKKDPQIDRKKSIVVLNSNVDTIIDSKCKIVAILEWDIGREMTIKFDSR
jgi:hypothetical protein